MRESLDFLKIAVQDLKTIGSVTSSSKFLIRKILEHIPFSHELLIVEFGAGNGCISSAILEQMRPDAKLLSFELHPMFYQRLQSIQDARVRFIHDNVVNLGQYVEPKSVGAIVSGLPLSNMQESEKVKMLQAASAALVEDGVFIQFQYSLGDYQLLKEHFREVKLDFAFFNVPPAFIYTAHN